MSNSQNRIKELDSLRGIAAFLVMLYHYTYGFNHNDQNIIFHFGYLGVNLFFMISGFVIFLTLNRIKSADEFIVSRFARLFPVYWASIFITIFILIVIYGSNAAISIIEVLSNLTMLEYWMKINYLNGVYWTLAVELSFYFFMFLLFLTKKMKNMENIAFGLLLFTLVCEVFNIKLIFSAIYFLKYSYLFLVGIIFYLWFSKGFSYKRLIFVVICNIYAIVLTDIASAIASLVFSVIFILFIYGKLKFLDNRILLLSGTLSYSFYLLHERIGGEVFYLLKQWHVDSLIIQIAVSFIISASLAYLLNKKIENPFNKKIKLFYKKMNKQVLVKKYPIIFDVREQVQEIG